jgi:hypothetical protein
MSTNIKENIRLQESRKGKKSWKKCRPYWSEHQWVAVREDFSDNGDAWGYFTHD